MTQRATVLLTTGKAEIGGTELQLVRLAKELTDIGLDVEVAFANSGGPLVQLLERDGIVVHTFRITKTLGGLKEFFNYRRLLRQRRFSIVHSFLPISIVISAAALTPRRNRPIFIAGLRGQVNRHSWGLRLALAAAMRRAVSITVNEPGLVRSASDFANVEQSSIRLLFNGVDIPTRASRPEVEPAVGVVLANFHTYKAHRTLLDALQQCRTKPNFVFFGRGGIEAEIRREIKSRQLEDQVEIRFEAMPQLDQFQFAVHPSLTEGLPNAVLEEMAYGLPVVASSVGGIPHLIGNNEGGYLCPPGDSVALATSIDRIMSSPERRRNMGQRNRSVASEFQWTETAIRYRDYYSRVVSESAS